MRETRWIRGFLNTCLATALYGVVHSFLASNTAKRAVEQTLGARKRNGLYRPFYLLQSVITIVPVIRYIRRQPSLTVFEFRGTASVPFRLMQAIALGWAVTSAYEVGFGGILGIKPLFCLFLGDEVPIEPEAQGPRLDGSEMRVRGPFKLSRHPLNLAPLGVLCFNPRMTTNLLAFDLVSAAYLMLGSLHEESRLRGRYGDAYRAYQSSGVNFYWPGQSRHAMTKKIGPSHCGLGPA